MSAERRFINKSAPNPASRANAGSATRILQRKCACGGTPGPTGECKACRKKKLQRRPSNLPSPTIKNDAASLVSEVPGIVHDVMRSTGQPLDSETRAFMEPRFGHNFSDVRLHTDTRAAESAQAVNALAYTVGSNIVLGRSDLASGTRQGRKLIAHELTHVIQQREQASLGLPLFFETDVGAPSEREADRVADNISGGGFSGPISTHPFLSLHRKVKVDRAKDLIDNPGGKGLTQTNAQTVEGYLQTLCSGGTVKIDKNSGSVSMAAGFCPKPMAGGVIGPRAPAPVDASKEPAGCNCLCDMVDSPAQWHIDVDDSPKAWPHTDGKTVTTVSPNSSKFWGTATKSGKQTVIDPWLVLGHELCGHAWLDEKKLPDENATRGEGGHQETVARENELRQEHGLEARGNFKDPYCGESFSKDKASGTVQWSQYFQKCVAWRKKNYGGKYKIDDKIP
ncbi:MAG: DUF4157 domain-containing protein [Chthoniobacterales bacterium]